MNIIETEVSRRLKGLPHNNNARRIVLHHAEATNCTVEDIDRWHRGRGWQGIGYHYFVRKDGLIYKGRPDYTMGAHCLHNNTNTIGICAEGKYMSETMPEVQKNSIIELCKYLGIKDIKGHRELNSTDCPGANYPLDEIRNVVINGGSSNSQPQQQSKPTQSVSIDSSVRDKVAYVTADVLNVRYTANGEIIGQLKKGDKVTLWNKEGNWYHIYSPVKGYNQAYVSCEYIKIGNPVSNNNSNNWVSRLQEECNKQGFSNQKVDGYAGQNTLNGCPTLRQCARGNITKLLQERLNALGYGTNGIDGIFGGGTHNAVVDFQRKHGLSADGICGRNTWAKLLGL